MGDTILAFVGALPNGTDVLSDILVSFLNCRFIMLTNLNATLVSVREGSSRAKWYRTHMMIFTLFKHVLIILFVLVHTYHVHAE